MLTFGATENVDESSIGRLFYLILRRRILTRSIFFIVSQDNPFIFFENDYMDMYKGNSTNMPLFFFIFTVATSGLKAIFSPVKLKNTKKERISQIFSAIDLYDNFNRNNKINKQNIIETIKKDNI